MTDSNRPTPNLAHDTRALPWEALTPEENAIIKGVNGLLRAIKEDNQSKGSKISRLSLGTTRKESSKPRHYARWSARCREDVPASHHDCWLAQTRGRPQGAQGA